MSHDKLKVYVDPFGSSSRRIWIAQPGRRAVSITATIPEFVDRHIDGYETIQLVGAADNAAMICELFVARERRQFKSLQVCNPDLQIPKRYRKHPEIVLREMDYCRLAPSQGGFHEVSLDDYAVYSLIIGMRNCRYDEFVSQKQRLLYAHPAYLPVSFVPHDSFALAKVLAEIVDPRWFIDLLRPNRDSKLMAYMGLDPKSMSDALRYNIRSLRVRRCRRILDAWRDAKRVAMGDRAKPLLESPADFIWRTWAGVYARSDGAQQPMFDVKCNLRASQKFLRFIRLVWLAKLYDTSGQGKFFDLFDPEQFFLYDVEADAFVTFLRDTLRVGR